MEEEKTYEGEDKSDSSSDDFYKKRGEKIIGEDNKMYFNLIKITNKKDYIP